MRARTGRNMRIPRSITTALVLAIGVACLLVLAWLPLEDESTPGRSAGVVRLEPVGKSATDVASATEFLAGEGPQEKRESFVSEQLAEFRRTTRRLAQWLPDNPLVPGGVQARSEEGARLVRRLDQLEAKQSENKLTPEEAEELRTLRLTKIKHRLAILEHIREHKSGAMSATMRRDLADQIEHEQKQLKTLSK